MKERYEHLTAEEIYLRVKEIMPETNLSTVYRNLEKFVSEGELLKIEAPNGPARYDANTAPHHHIRCVVCGKVDDIPVEPKISFSKNAIRDTGYEFLGIKVVFLGICPSCQEKKKTH